MTWSLGNTIRYVVSGSRPSVSWYSPIAASLLASLSFAATAIHAGEPTELPQLGSPNVEFATDIQPLLEDHCLDCHGPDDPQSNFRVDRRQSLIDGGESGEPAVVVGNSEDSHLIKILMGRVPSLTMPPDGKGLEAAEINLLRAWIDQGLEMPTTEPSPGNPTPSDHWSLQPLRRPPVPEPVPHDAPGADPAANPIDRFILAQLQETGLPPSPPADPATLIRRVYLDMLGLLPSPREVEAFASDDRPDAYVRLVDRVLASPHYGERWARHWLDVVRFAESNGYETNHERPTAYHYRDYVVRALNQDLPFDRFVFEQLAGDTVGADAATGFLVGGANDIVSSPDPVLTAMQRQDELADMINTTGTALLGLSIGCARCHNHKFDPVTQQDFYQLQAVFAGVRHGERPLMTPQVKANRRQAKALQAELAKADRQLTCLLAPASPAPASRAAPPLPPRVLWIDDAQTPPAPHNQTPNNQAPNLPTVGDQPRPRMLALAAARGEGVNPEGTERGWKQDPGGPGRLPNVSGGRYTWWAHVPGQNVAAYAPKVEGEWRVWLSWGCGWDTHTPNAVYLLDRDGDPATTDDQKTIAQVDQRRFADGSGEPVGLPLWSGFFDAGTHWFGKQSRILLRGGSSGTAITADAIALQWKPPTATPTATAAAAAALPRLRAAASAKQNAEAFTPRTARLLRMTISATNTESEPCLDELEVWTTDQPGQPPRNVALASAGTRVRSSGDYSGSPKHRLAHLHDGRYGNDHSWISSTRGAGWVELEFASPVRIDRVTWGRDRTEHYRDRLPVAYRIEIAEEPGQWQLVASSEDRLPVGLEADPWGLQLAHLSPSEAQRGHALAARRSELERRIKTLTTPSQAYLGRFETPGTTHRLYRGDPMAPREPVPPDTLDILGSLSLSLDAPEQQRRIALANSIIDPANPLTARVMANRLWHYHFGQGLVATPSDFGSMGARPTHPELLDWLAAELRDGLPQPQRPAERDPAGEQAAQASRWSLKRLQRLILLSATYRQASRPLEEAMARDADSRLLWRFPPRRLEAEAIRDNILLVSGTLDRRMEGPGYWMFHPNSNYARNWVAKDEFGPDAFRRMLYAIKLRMEQDAVFGAFDCPDGGQVAPRRTASTTPIQALNLFNSDFVIDQAERFAERVRRAVGDDPQRQVTLVFAHALGRPPEPAELSEAVTLVGEHGLPALCRAIYNANAFLFLR
ncbi:PSD1 and planctomycete cytochrome C domain-containing protein [Candidatus Laterigemmans baculatus]|uniref:PSD1 and planctomycete cytochrome C domain-containing protein n=1 Tax=Candidatus Laterigemmans baculatus TaxID=2770505 RepID=UPI0013DC7E9A|nr:PSD1 and planctomycete cytochrome C domain-containing protein [Candidatus Laterigemmans baculatus]